MARAPSEDRGRRSGTRLAGLFPSQASLLRLVSAVLTKLSEERKTDGRYLCMDAESYGPASRRNRICKKMLPERDDIRTTLQE